MPSSLASFPIASWITPSVEPHPSNVTWGIVSPPQLRRFDQRQNRFHLAHPFFTHGLALVRVSKFIADEHAVFIVVVGGPYAITQHPGKARGEIPSR